MFGNNSNPFGALAVNEEQPTAGPSSQVVDGDEIDVDWIKLVKTNHDVNVRVSAGVELGDLPNECNLMVVSNVWGLLVVGSSTDVRIHSLSDFHSSLEGAARDASPAVAPVQTITLPARPVWIRLAMNEERLVVATANGSGVHAFKLRDVLSGNMAPYYTFSSGIPSHLLDVLPNPAPSSDQLARYVTLLANEGLVIADLEECKLAEPLPGPFTCASWSAKGKQIVVGTPSGKLVQYTPEGVIKSEIPAPPDLESFHPTFVQWLENDLFFVSYAQADSQPDDPIETYIIHRQKAAFTFAKFFDPLNTMGLVGRSGAYRHFAGLRSWGEKTKHLAFVASGLASEIGVLHGNTAAEKEPPKWEVLVLEETARGVLPAAKAGVRDDASVLALALDLTSDKVITQGIVGGIELPDLPPQPRLLAYTQEGVIISFDVRYAEAGTYPGMVVPQTITSASQQTTPSILPTASTTPVSAPAPSPAPSAFGSSGSAFGSSGFGSSAFGQSTPSKPATAFGGSAFGQPSTPAFGSSAKPAAFGASSFGQSSTPSSSPAPAAATFGATSKPAAFGGFGQSSSSAFGQSAFGQPAKPSAFGSSTPSAFGSTSSTTPAKPPTTGSAPSAFGQSSTPSSAFGQSAFGQPSKPTTSTPSAFGTPSKPSAFGSSSTPSAVGSSTTPSAFGSSTTPSNPGLGFGGFGSKASSTGSTAFGFGAASAPAEAEEKKDGTASAFGSGGSAFGTSSAFGSGSALGSTSAFGKPNRSPSMESVQSAFAGHGLKPISPDRSSTFAGFGQKSQTSEKPPAFAGFGPKPEAEKQTGSAFAGFGQKPAASTSAFTGFGQAKPATAAADPPAKADADDFGLGGFASVLDSSANPAEVDDSPPSSPIIGASKVTPVFEDDSPSASPVIGASKALAAPDDESPPNSPPIKAPVQQATAPSSTPKPSPAFIKPATAFGSAPSSGFGSFGHATTKPAAPAFGAGSTPAFSSPAAAATPSAFGTTAFGKPSTIGASAKPAFGSSAFGQSSVPGGSAFGQSASPAANTKPFGAITGGFGAFGTKPEAEKKPAGFGGFASSGTSIFGGAADKDKKDAKTANIFGAAPSTSAFSPVSKPSTPSAGVKQEQPTTPSKEQAKTDDVSEPSTTSEAKQSTSPTVTPSKSVQDAPSTTPTQAPAKHTVAEASTTPKDKETATGDTTTPAVTPSKPPTKSEGAEVVIRAGEEPEEYNVEVNHSSVSLEDDEDDEDDAEDEYEEHEEGAEEDYEDEGDYEDDYEGEEEDYDEEAEEDEEDEDHEPQGRRRSTSIPPDMSPIKEEASDDLTSEEEAAEDDQHNGDEVKDESLTTSTRSLTKSPPAWFAKPIKGAAADTDPTSPTPGSEGASLFARLSPAPSPKPEETASPAPEIIAPVPVQAKLPAPFSFKHAARTSSPLAAPPSNAESTTPESSPAKPAASAFSSFGGKPADAQSDATAPTPSVFGGGLFAAKPTEVKPSSGFTGFGAPAPAGSSLFGQQPAKSPLSEAPPSLFGSMKPNAAGKPEGNSFNIAGISSAPKIDAPPSLFETAKAAPSAATEAPKPAFGLGLGRPGAFGSPLPSPSPAPVPAAKPTFSFSKPDVQSSVVPSPALPAPSTPSPALTVAPTKFTVPSRESVSVPAPATAGSRSMGALVEQIITTLNGDISRLTAILEANAKHHAAFNVTSFPKISSDNLNEHKMIPFSSVTDLAAIVKALSGELAQLRSDDGASELKLAEVQSRMLKTDMKIGQADKFVKARQDPTFARAMQIKELSPEQASSQTTLRKGIQVAESRLEALEASIGGLRRRAERHEQGRGVAQQPALERVQRSVRNIDAAIRDRQQTIDDLARRIGGIRLSSPSRSGSPAPSRTHATPRRSTVPGSNPGSSKETISFEPSKDVLQDVDAALNARAEKAGLMSRLQKLKVARLTQPAAKHASSSKGPVMIDALPLPGQLPPPPTPRSGAVHHQVKSELAPRQTPTPNLASSPASAVSDIKDAAALTSSPSPSFGFGGIKFSLDPGNVADLASSRSSGSASGAGGRGGGSSNHRTHAPAAKFVPPTHAAASGGDGTSSIAKGSDLFAFKKEEKDDKSETKAPGFFSFSGFGKK